ncbi:MAG: hypothetical protein EON93_19620, partial [Burkholderiales bacterium]
MNTAADTDYKALQQQNAELNLRVADLTHQLEQLKRMIFGSRSERFVPAVPENPAQLSLGLDSPLVEQQPQTQQISYDRTVKTPVTKAENPNLNGRNALPPHLRREEIVIQPDDLPQGAVCIGNEV